MKFSCNSNDLLKAVSIVEKAVASRTTLEVLENIYLALNGPVLTLRANDLELGIQVQYSLDNAQENGSVLIKAKTLSSILSKLQNIPLHFEMNPQTFHIRLNGDSVNYELLGMSVDDFPAFPTIQEGSQLQIEPGVLLDALRKTLFCAASDEKKKHLAGVYVSPDNGQLVFVATDGYRLAVNRMAYQAPLPDMTPLILPIKAIQELIKILPIMDQNDRVTITLSAQQVAFHMGETRMISRLIDAKFPDYQHVVPKNPSQVAILSRRALMDACDRASIVASQSNQVVRMVVGVGQLTLQASAASIGEFKESLSMARQMGQEETKIAFNVKLLLDALRNIDSDDVKLSFNNGVSPCLIEPMTESGYLYVVMPIKTNEFQDSPAPASTAPSYAEQAVG